jgi:IS66 C-terminal element
VFLGSDQGGKTAAVLRRFVASCHCAGLDPYAWFKDVLARIAAHPIARLAELLPHNWAPAQSCSPTQTRPTPRNGSHRPMAILGRLHFFTF